MDSKKQSLICLGVGLVLLQLVSGMSLDTRQTPVDAAAAVATPFSRLFSAGYSDAIREFRFDASSGSLTPVKRIQGNPNLSFMEFGSRHSLYAIHEVQWFEGKNDGGLSRWEVMPPTHWQALERRERKVTHGWGTAHVNVDTENGFIYVSNYGGGSFTAFKLNADETIGDVVYTEKFGNGQVTSHVHGAAVYRTNIYVVDLGSNKIFHYKVSGGAIVKATPPFVSTPAASGPRHVTIDASRGFAFVVFELQNLVISYKIDSATGALSQISSTTILPDDVYNKENIADYGAEIAVSPNKEWVYVSNRGHGAIVVYRIQQDGALTRTQIFRLQGSWPRHFLVHPEGRHILVALQKVNRIEVVKVGVDGTLEAGSLVESQNSPTVLALMP